MTNAAADGRIMSKEVERGGRMDDVSIGLRQRAHGEAHAFGLAVAAGRA